MNKSNILRLIKLILTTKNFDEFLKNLNLDLNSSFLCLFGLLQESILKYDSIDDYSYLDKLCEYLKYNYYKLSDKNKQNQRNYIIKLKSFLKKDLGNVSEYDREYFKKAYYTLEMLLLSKKEKNKEILDLDLSDLLYEIIFSFHSLEYLDLLIEKDNSIVNSKRKNDSIFTIVFHEYINAIVNKNEFVSYYIRVLYKFLHTESFNFTNEMKEDILNSLDTFLNFKKISNERFEEIKDLYAYVKNQYVVSNLKIPNMEYEMNATDLSYLDNFDIKKKERQKINEYIITIDDEESMVLDDAISITKLRNGNISFKIHIADPLSVFAYKSSIIQDAKERTSTIYLKDSVIQMFPSIISENLFSLVEKKDRYAKTFCIEYNEHEGIVNFKIINSIINVNKRCSYDGINDLYKKGGTTEEEETILRYYDDVLNYLKKMFKNAKIYEEFKRSNIIGHRQKMNSFSENLICYSMLTTGYLTAKYFDDNNLPFAYRCHQFDQKWQEFLDNYMNIVNQNEYKKMFKDLKNRFPKSYYSLHNDGHMGLKIDYYSHVTSPLRRYIDILNMHSINTCYFNNPSDRQLDKLKDEISSTCDYINMQSNTIDEYITKKLIK